MRLTCTSVDETWAYRKERVAPSTELGGVFRVNEVQGGLRNPIGRRSDISGLLDELGITSSARDINNLLLSTLFNQRKESVGNSDRSNDIGPILLHRSGMNYFRYKQWTHKRVEVLEQAVVLAYAGTPRKVASPTFGELGTH